MLGSSSRPPRRWRNAWSGARSSGSGGYVRTVKVGDRVLFSPDDQFEVEVQGHAYLVMRERDLHAVAAEQTEHGTGLYL